MYNISIICSRFQSQYVDWLGAGADCMADSLEPSFLALPCMGCRVRQPHLAPRCAGSRPSTAIGRSRGTPACSCHPYNIEATGPGQAPP